MTHISEVSRASYVHVVRFSDGNEFWNHKDNYRLSCRPVRLVAAPYYLNCGSPHGSSQAEV